MFSCPFLLQTLFETTVQWITNMSCFCSTYCPVCSEARVASDLQVPHFLQVMQKMRQCKKRNGWKLSWLTVHIIKLIIKCSDSTTVHARWMIGRCNHGYLLLSLDFWKCVLCLGFLWRAEDCYPALGFSWEAIWTFREKIRSTRCTTTCRDETSNFLSIWTVAVWLRSLMLISLVLKWRWTQHVFYPYALHYNQGLRKELPRRLCCQRDSSFSDSPINSVLKQVFTPHELDGILSGYNHKYQRNILRVWVIQIKGAYNCKVKGNWYIIKNVGYV